MTDVSDIEEMVRSSRAFIIADGGIAAGIRTFDGISELLVEVIRELRRVNDNLEGRRGQDA
jgi:hypothetical protein